MENMIGFIRMSLGRCKICGNVEHYVWIVGETHFQIKCKLCGKKNVLLIDDEKTTDEDINAILEFISKSL